MRRRAVIGNWKLHNTIAETKAFCEELASLAPMPHIDVGVAPVYTCLPAARATLRKHHLLVAQDVHWEDQGAFTGAVGAPALVDVGCTHVLVGHSERRQLFGDSDAAIKKRLGAALRAGLVPILCVGETLEEREAQKTEARVKAQLQEALRDQPASALSSLLVAYEPVWAIGTGRVAAAADAQAVHATLRKALFAIDPALAADTRILYGGSVKPDNVGALLAQVDIDGALVGGASLDFTSFSAIVGSAAQLP